MRFKVFVSHSYNDRHHILDVSAFRGAVSGVFLALEKNMSEEASEVVSFDLYFEDSRFGMPLPTELRQRVRGCDLFIIDLAGATANTFYELGYAHATGRELLIVQASKRTSRVPADISDLLIGRYDTLESLAAKIRVRVEDAFSSRLKRHGRYQVVQNERCFWFPPNIQEIHVICAPEPERTRFAHVEDPDYLYIDNLDDRDSLFEVVTFLSRAYPNARILRHAAGAHTADVLECNLVILGGPHNNRLTEDFAHALGARFVYADHEDALTFKAASSEYTIHAEVSTAGVLTADVGYFGMFPNPFNTTNRVVMCHGCHTFGTLAATLIFADNNRAIENASFVSRSLRHPPSRIECAFRVAILSNRRIVAPQVDSTLIYVE